jgi:undecaprenyl-diphosphatase
MGHASAILGGILLFFLLQAWLCRWAVRHEADIKQEWKQFLRRPHITELRLRIAPQIAFLHARLSPSSYCQHRAEGQTLTSRKRT